MQNIRYITIHIGVTQPNGTINVRSCTMFVTEDDPIVPGWNHWTSAPEHFTLVTGESCITDVLHHTVILDGKVI